MNYERGTRLAHMAYTDEGYLEEYGEKADNIYLPSEIIKQVARGNAMCAFHGGMGKTQTVTKTKKGGQVSVTMLGKRRL